MKKGNMYSNDNGIFIVLEGGEGAGKSTIIKFLETELNKLDVPVTTLREPGGTSFAEDVRDVFFSHQDLSPSTSVHLMNAQRLDNIEKIITPALNKHRVVIADRFTASTLVYQGLLNNQYGTVEPIMLDHEAINIFVDVTPEVGLKRIADNKRETNYFDEMKLEKHQRIYGGFKELSVLKEDSYWDILLDGQQELSAIESQMKDLAKHIRNAMLLEVTTGELKSQLREKGL